MPTIDEMLNTAVKLHQAGDLAEAEKLYRQVLSVQPRHADARHLLGVIAHQAGHHQAAVEFIGEAIQLNGAQAAYHHHYGQACYALGRMDDARSALEQAIKLDSRLTATHYQLGVLEHMAGNLEAAAECYERAVGLEPDFVEARVNLGNVRQAQGRNDDAAAAYQTAIRSRPDCLEAHYHLGNLLTALERFGEAVASFQEVLRLQPTLAEAHYNLGNAYRHLGWLDDAAQCFERAIELKPDFGLPHCGLGSARRDQGRLDEAARAYREGVRLAPDYAEGIANFGKVLHMLGHHEEALAQYNRAIELQPHLGMAHFNRAVLFNELNQPDEALAMSRQGLEVEPNSARLYGNIAVALHLQGRVDEAIDNYRRATDLAPTSAMGHSNLLYALNFSQSYDPATVFAEHLTWGQRHAEPLTMLAPLCHNDPSPDRRLRVGYVSPYFRHHAVNYFTEPILLAHDHEAFEVVCYSDVRNLDETTECIRGAADQWHDVRTMSAEALANRVRDDAIDILVDLTGHIGGSRLLVFARRPAPVQITYIGYQNTTGMSAMDYRLTDDRADPPGLTDAYYTEKLVRLPRAFFCYRPFALAPAVSPLPALEAGYVTFGSFNNIMKITPAVVAAWLEILQRVPRSRLLMLAYRGGYLERSLHERATALGIAPARIELVDKCSTPDYLRLQQRADIALDPFPFNGHTTTCDSLWMGVPVVMMEGETYASRFGGTALVHVGLESLIARSVEEYVELAVALAGDVPRLTELRTTLRTRMAESVLLDAQGFTRSLETVYRRLWHDWCRSQSSSV